MAVTLTGTPTAIVWAAGADPAGQSITIPGDATAVYMFWSYWNNSNGSGLSSVTLNGNAPNETHEVTTSTTGKAASGVAVWYNPATGSQTLDPVWDAAPGEGPTCIVAYATGGNTTGWRDVDGATEADATEISFSLTTATDDLVLKYDQKYTSGTFPPSTSSGWTTRQTQTNNSESARLSSANAPGDGTTTCASEDEYYSSQISVAIPVAAAGGSSNGAAAISRRRRNTLLRM